MTTHVIVVPLVRPPCLSNDQRRWHWTKVRAAKRLAEEHIGWAVRRAKLRGPIGPCAVRVVWHTPDMRRRDVDSLSPFLKAVLDSLVALRVIKDDSHHHVTEATCAIQPDPANPRLEIVITTN